MNTHSYEHLFLHKILLEAFPIKYNINEINATCIRKD